jgi:alpha-tubulin suppressor-like RCC1 family protein
MGTPAKRSSRAGTVFALPRLALNSNPALSDAKAGRVPPDLGGVVAIAGGPDHVLALLPDGRVRAWGDWSGEAVAVPSEAANVVRLDSSEDSVLALREDGKVVAWGRGKPAAVWAPPAGKAPVEVCAGANASGYVLCTDGSAFPTSDDLSPAPAGLGPIVRLFYVPQAGFGGLRRDGTPAFWGNPEPPVTPLPGDLRDVISFSFAQRYAVALQRDGTLIGWGELAQDEKFRTRKFTGSLGVPNDYAGRVFPVHRSDHSWELVPNPNVPAYVAEDRPALIEGKLRGCVDAVFTQHYVIGLRY